MASSRMQVLLIWASVTLLAVIAVRSTAAPRAESALVPEEAKAEAVELLGAAVYKREEGELGLALELANQARAKWPDSPDARSFQATVIPAATADARGVITH